MDSTDFKFDEPRDVVHSIGNGDVRIVNIPVKVIFEWSDKIIADSDSETDTVLEYTSGYVMKVIPNQVFIFNGQESDFLYQVSL